MLGGNNMKTVVVAIAILFSSLCSLAENHRARIIAKISPKNLHLSSVLREGGGTYSIIDNNRVVVAKGKELFVISNNSIMQKIKCPSVVSTFGINRHGNGVIVSDGLLYRVKALQIQPKAIRIIIPGANRGSFIYRLDMVDDSTVRIIPSAPQIVLIANIDSLERNQYVVLEDALSRNMYHNHEGEYIGRYGNEFFVLEYGSSDDIERVIVFEIKNNKPAKERVIELGNLGRAIPMSCPVRFDESSGLFYVMLVQQGDLVIREFQIEDFAKS